MGNRKSKAPGSSFCSSDDEDIMCESSRKMIGQRAKNVTFEGKKHAQSMKQSHILTPFDQWKSRRKYDVLPQNSRTDEEDIPEAPKYSHFRDKLYLKKHDENVNLLSCMDNDDSPAKTIT